MSSFSIFLTQILRIMFRKFLFGFCCLLAPQISYAQNKFISDSLDTYINREMKRWNLPGCAVAVIYDGKVVSMKGYGVREVGKTAKVDENTLFQIASNTKAFTGTALALLDYQKRLSLDDKVTKYLPDFKLYDELAAREVTIRDMLCHRIGFSTFQSDFLNWDCNLTRKELIMNMRTVKPQHSFRSRYGYCNMGFVTVGEIVKTVSDTTWEDFLKAHFFIPLNMNRTTTRYTAIVGDSNAARPYTIIENKLTRIDYANIDNIGPCASINSCIKDISNWILMQLDSGKFNGKQVFPYSVIKQTVTSNMIVREPSGRIPSNHFTTYGLGWQLEDMYGVKVVSHNGGANGFVTNTTIIPEWNAGFVILTNNDANSFYGALRQQLLNAMADQPYKNISEVYFVANEKANAEDQKRIDELRAKTKTKIVMDLPLDKFAGKYKNEVYGDMEIKKEKSGLMMYLSHHPRVVGVLDPVSPTEFMCTFSDPTYGIHSFPVKIESGSVRSITVKVNDFIDYLPYEFIKTN